MPGVRHEDVQNGEIVFTVNPPISIDAHLVAYPTSLDPDPSALTLYKCLPLPQSQALEIWEQKAEDELGPITNIATGGDAERRRLLVEGYTTTDLRDLPGTWQKSLIELPLFNKQVGPRGISHNFDWKHMEKRKRQRDMCKTKGNQIGEGGTLNAETIIPVFDIIFGKKDWNPLFQPQDR